MLLATAIVITNNAHNAIMARRRTLWGKITGQPCPSALEVGSLKRHKLVEKTKLAILVNRDADMASKFRAEGKSPREILKLMFRF